MMNVVRQSDIASVGTKIMNIFERRVKALKDCKFSYNICVNLNLLCKYERQIYRFVFVCIFIDPLPPPPNHISRWNINIVV